MFLTARQEFKDEKKRRLMKYAACVSNFYVNVHHLQIYA